MGKPALSLAQRGALALSLALACSLGLALVSTPALAVVITFTGDVDVDLDPALDPRIRILADPGGITDVAVPSQAPEMWPTGWNMEHLAFFYDGLADVLFVGMNFPNPGDDPSILSPVICGDADNDGDPGRTSQALADLGGTDHPDLTNYESVLLVIDTNNDQVTGDVIAGVPPEGSYSDFVVASFSGSLLNPVGAFGPPLPQAAGSYLAFNPSADHPDFEFTIDNFSELPNLNYDPAQDCSITASFLAFAGGMNDAVGEDWLPRTNALQQFSFPVVRPQLDLDKVLLTQPPHMVSNTVEFLITITNTGCSTITLLPLDDTYDPNYLRYERANPEPDASDPNAGTLRWDDLTLAFGRDMPPGDIFTLTVEFHLLAPTPAPTDNCAEADEAVDEYDYDVPPDEECAPLEIDLWAEGGDAPTTANNLGQPMSDQYGGALGSANFPVTWGRTAPASGDGFGMCHDQGTAISYLGTAASFELDADRLPDSDGLTNIDPAADLPDRDGFDDGITFPASFASCRTMLVDVTGINSNTTTLYLNGWFDWKRDGDWNDHTPLAGCNCGENEWAAHNIVVPTGPFHFQVPVTACHPTGIAPDDPLWSRWTLSDQVVSVAPEISGGRPQRLDCYADGETEDYLVSGEAYSLGDRVWYDTDQDGIQQPGEPGVVGISAYLYDNADCDDLSIASTTTGANGHYLFEDLPAGEYCVDFANIPAGWLVSPADQGGDNALDSDAAPSLGQIDNIVLAGDDLTQDMGIYAPGTLGDTVWCDDNYDDSFDAGEGVSGVTVTLYRDLFCDGNTRQLIGHVDTLGDGNYLFNDLPTGPLGDPICYIVEVDPADMAACDDPITPTAYQTALDTGRRSDLANDFGFRRLLLLGDLIWYDRDRDGLQDAGEPGVAGVQVNLHNNATCSGVPVATDTTDAAGEYGFTDLIGGDYCLAFSGLPVGWQFTAPDVGADDRIDSDANPSSGRITALSLLDDDLHEDVGVYGLADLSVVKADSQDPVFPGTYLVYTLTVHNAGPAEALDVVVTDMLPLALHFISATPPNHSGPNPLIWNLGKLAVGQTVPIRIATQVQSVVPQIFVNPVDVASFTPDPNPQNNHDEEPTELLVPAIDVTKRIDREQAVPGQPFTYTVEIHNIGQLLLDPVALTDTLPPNFGYVAGSADPVEPDLVAEPELVWHDLGALAPGQSIEVSFKVVALPGIFGTFRNHALGSGEFRNGKVRDNSWVDVVMVRPKVEVNKVLSDLELNTEPPNYITFTVYITNTGISVIDVLRFQDLYDPWFLSFLHGSPPPNQPEDDGIVTWLDLTAPAPHGFDQNLPPGGAFAVTAVFTVIHDITVTENIALAYEIIDIYGNPGLPDEDTELVTNVPTPVEMLYFHAVPHGEEILVEWETAWEVDLHLFGLYRAQAPDRTQAELVHSVVGEGDPFSGTTYAYRDTQAIRGSDHYYWLEAVDNDGSWTRYGPVRARLPFRTFLAVVSR